jgi:ankyrin repeat protein
MRKQFFFAITVLILMMPAIKPGPTSGKKISFEVVTTAQELSKDKQATKELFANLSPENYKKQSKKEINYLNLSLDLDNADSEFNLPIDDSDYNASNSAISSAIEKSEDEFDLEQANIDLFILARIGNDTKILELFLKANGKLNINVKNQYQETPLYLAVHFNNSKTVKLLCSLGAHINQHIGFGWNFLLIAVNHNDFETAQVLLESGIEKNAQTPVLKETALHKAVEKGSHRLIELLLTHGLLDLPNIFGQTALFNAIKYNHHYIAMALATSFEGALSHHDEKGLTPIQFADIHGYYVRPELRNLAPEKDLMPIVIQKEVGGNKEKKPRKPKKPRK